MTKEISDARARLWVDWFVPHPHGGRALGPADDPDVVEPAHVLKREGSEVETFGSALGKLSSDARGSEHGLAGARGMTRLKEIERLYDPFVCGLSFSCRGCRELTPEESPVSGVDAPAVRPPVPCEGCGAEMPIASAAWLRSPLSRADRGRLSL